MYHFAANLLLFRKH